LIRAGWARAALDTPSSDGVMKIEFHIFFDVEMESVRM
jgi:hypothetical protein